MAANIGVSLEDLTKVSQSIKQTKIDADKHLSSVSDNVTSLRSVWEDAATENLQQIANSINDRSQELGKELTEFGNFLDDIIRNWDTASSQVSGIIGFVLGNFK